MLISVRGKPQFGSTTYCTALLPWNCPMRLFMASYRLVTPPALSKRFLASKVRLTKSSLVSGPYVRLPILGAVSVVAEHSPFSRRCYVCPLFHKESSVRGQISRHDSSPDAGRPE